MSSFKHPISAAACLERWHAAHKDVVERVFRKRLRRFPNSIDDGIQSFWLDFLEEERCERFNPELCPSEAGYVGVFASWRAMNLLRELMNQPQPPAEVSEQAQPQVTHTTRDDANRYLLHLISTNRLKPAEAVVFICKVWISTGPVELEKSHGSSTLFELCDLVAARLEGARDEMAVPRQVLRVLREQLALPPGGPLGEQKLLGLVENGHHLAGGHTGPGRSLRDVLFDHLEKAKRVCVKEEKRIHESTREFVKRVVAEFLTALKSRFGFLIGLARDVLRPVHAEKLLAWSWERLLNIEAENYGGLSCAMGSRWFLARMAFLLPGYPAPNDLDKSLTGCQPNETILHALELLGTTANYAVRAVEERYRRASLVKG